jgi:hypothetical protein
MQYSVQINSKIGGIVTITNVCTSWNIFFAMFSRNILAKQRLFSLILRDNISLLCHSALPTAGFVV